MSFNDKVVLVTGASSGIGAAIAIAFAKEGADVAMVGRNETKLAAVEKQCAAHGKPPLVIIADVSKDEDANRIVQTTVDKYGKLDVLVNNAGINRSADIMDGTLVQVYDEVAATNLRAPILLTSLSAPHLIKTKGNIINISSVATQIPSTLPKFLPYYVSKGALNHFTIGSAVDLASHGVRVNAISPGPVYSDILDNSQSNISWDHMKKFTALDRVSDPEEIADLALYLASDKAKCITGSNYTADNGTILKR